MASIIRRLRRSNRKAAKFRFTVTLQELQLLTDETWKPETLVVSFVHRRRKVSSKERKWEQSFSDQSKCVIVWPEQMRDSIDIVTTLYRSQDDDQYQDKEWTIVIEEITAKGKRRAIAAVPLNVRLFILDLPDHKSELKLKLRPLVSKLRQSSLILLLGSALLKESIADDMSITSSVMDKTVDEVDLANSERILDTRRELESVVIQSKSTPPKVAPIIFEEKRRIEEVPPPIPVHKQSTDSEKVRPIWRVSQEPVEDTAGSLPKRQSRTSRASTEDSKTPSTTAVFEVDANSRPVPVNNNLNTGTIPRKRSHSPRAPSRDTVPQPIVGEGLLVWCQRITDGYTNLKVNDFTKSWRNGLALCAILHTYRPDLIGDYEQLDFSDRVDGRKSNIKKALVATRMMGLNDIPDENDFLTPDRKSIELLLQKIRRIFEGNFEDATPTSASDHRISNMFGISETEQKVVDMIKKMKEKQEEDNAVDYSNVKDEDDEQIKVSKNDSDFIIDDDTEISTLNFNRNDDSIIIATPGLTSIRSSGRHASPSKHDELRRRARDMLEKKASTLTTTPLNGKDNGENERFRDQARQLIDNATTDGTTFKIMASRNATPTTPIIHGSSTDLRRVEIVRANVDVHRFKKRDPSPTLVRKQYDPNDTPHLPAISRSANYGSRNRLDELLTSNPFDRVKRYGSMRSAELKESLQLLAKQYGYGAEEVLATPTKKFSSQWEKDVHDVEGTALEQEKIEQRLSDVEQQSKAIEAKIRDTEKGESEELMLLETFMRLTNEKNTLVGKQEYYNIIENIRQTTQQIDKFAKQLDDMTKNIDDDYQKSTEEKSETDKLMEDYRKALDQKSTLVQKLFATEEEMYDDEDRLKNLTLDRASRFVRGIDQPVSASKRLMQWWRR